MLKIKLMFLLIYGALLGILVSCLSEDFSWSGVAIGVVLIAIIVYRLIWMFKRIDRINLRLRNKGTDNPI